MGPGPETEPPAPVRAVPARPRTGRLSAAVLVLAAIVLGHGAPAAAAPYARGNTLARCLEKLDATGDAGGWCALGAPMATVRPKDRPDIWCVEGPSAMLVVWTGAAFDPAAGRAGTLYFPAGGGHAAYCGNETYAFDIASGRWTLLTEPCPLTLRMVPGSEAYGRAGQRSNRAIMAPRIVCGPSAAHTYDGVQFSRRTGTIFWVAGVYATEIGGFDSRSELWEFNPSRTETRNGIRPLKWRLHRKPDGRPFSLPIRPFAASLELPGGDLVYAGFGLMHAFRFDPRDPQGTIRPVASQEADRSNGNMIWDESRGVAWAVARHWLARYALDGGQVEIVGTIGAGAGNGLALRRGKLIFWNGLSLIHEYDPDTRQWRMWDWGDARPPGGDTAVYSKWVYLPAHDVFVGVTGRAGQAVVYRHPASGGVPVSTGSAQRYVDAAPRGGTVRIPPGAYGGGLTINRPLTVELAGVRLLGIAANKGRILVDDPGGPVVIRDFVTADAPRCVSNCAGVRVQGRNTDVTIERSRILNHEMGVLTGNDGGRLVIVDSEIGATGGGGDLSHVVYAGWSDRLEIRRSTIRDSRRLGHLVKSRAAVTVIDESRILGGRTRHSRLIDAPCGGEVTITGSVLEQGDQTDNAEMILMGGGSLGNCVGNPNRISRLVIGGGTRITSRRDFSEDEPAWQAGPTALLKWLAPNTFNVELGADTVLQGLEILAYNGPHGRRVPLP